MAELDELVSSNYRVDNRNPPRAGVSATCLRPGASEPAPDLVMSILDVTDIGVGLTVREIIRRNQLVEVSLIAPGWAEPVVRLGRVVWSDVVTGTVCRIGVVFAAPVSFEELEELCHLPKPRPPV